MMNNDKTRHDAPLLGRSDRPLTILIASKVDSSAVDTLRSRHRVICAFGAPEAELVEHIDAADVLVFRSGVQINERVLGAARKLGLIVRAGSGLDNLDVPALRAMGIPLIRVPGPGARAVAELAFTLMLMLARQVRTADMLLRQGRWAKGTLDGFILEGKRLGIIGAGNIGACVGRMGSAWGMSPLGCVEGPTGREIERLNDAGIELADMDTVLREADFVSVHVPLAPSTRNLIDAAALAKMRPGSFLVNLARGGVVDEDALYDALTSGTGLAGAALDVHAREGEGKISRLASLDNVVLTPHIGASTVDTQRQIGERIVDIVSRSLCVGDEWRNGDWIVEDLS